MSRFLEEILARLAERFDPEVLAASLRPLPPTFETLSLTPVEARAAS